jgi:hypothetical protein
MGAYSPTTPIRVGWQKVPSVGQLVGRFAYWVDDESTKVNVNTAQSRASDPFGFTPAAIDLSQLFSTIGSPLADANAIVNYTTGTRPLDTIESIKLTQPAVANAPSISANSFFNDEFFVTANATSPDLTPWGDKRTNLTALLTGVITPAQKRAVVPVIANVLSSANMGAWSGGKTFLNKYNNVNQIAANIVDYITPDNIPTDSGSGPLDLTPPTFLGLKQTPYLNELVISNTFVVATDPVLAPAGTITISSTVTAELWYMYTNSTGWSPPPGTSIVVQGSLPILINPPVQAGPISVGGGLVTIKPIFPHMGPSDGTVNGGQFAYRTVVATLPPVTFPVTDTGVGYTAQLLSGGAAAIFTSPLGRMDYAQITFLPTPIPPAPPVAIPAAPATLTLVWQAQCNDPRVKPISTPWQQITNGLPNTLGTFNTSVNMVMGSGTITGDGDISCHILSGSNHRGTMYPSELAYIHTGIPWRTFYLEPQPVAEIGSLPDWLAVDLFSTTDITNVPGRMNINVVNGDPNSYSPARTQPLSALLSGNPSAAAVANNISGFQVHNTPPLPAFATVPNAPNTFTTAGQICEVDGLADAGSLTPKSLREAPAEAVVNLVTPRSDTFTIWAIAQSIKKVALAPPLLSTFVSGTDLITGEVMIQAVVQRYEVPSTIPGTPATVRFRTLYYRYIYQ